MSICDPIIPVPNPTYRPKTIVFVCAKPGTWAILIEGSHELNARRISARQILVETLAGETFGSWRSLSCIRTALGGR